MNRSPSPYGSVNVASGVSPGPGNVRRVREIVLEGPRGLRLRCRVAERRRDRARGLIGVRILAADEALLLPYATSIHTIGMRITILVARLDADLRVLAVRRVPPWRVLLPRRGARHVLESEPGLDLRAGDRLRVAILPRLSPAARAPIV
jgi:uncharacterized protein